MDIQKAVEWIRAISATQSNSLNKNSLADRKEALHMAVAALEKQMPKKPIRVDVGHNGSSTDGCPVCKREFYEKFGFCPDCGTALDWNE